MKDCVAAVGTFDGVHLGHKEILATVRREAETRGLETRAITFMNHPLSVIAHDRVPKLIQPRHTTVEELKQEVNRVSEMNFTPELAALTAREFLKLIAERYKVKVLVMGHDNTFGSDRLSTQEEYAEAAREAGIEIVTVGAKAISDGTVVSSSAIRRALAEGDVVKAGAMRGEFVNIVGCVEHGKRNGHKLGFPTLNLDHTSLAPLQPGVYMCLWNDADNDFDEDYMDYVALLNVGNNPTISDNNATTYELHIVGANLGECYGREINAQLVARLRDEQKFSSLKELKDQITADISVCGTIIYRAGEENKDAFDRLHPKTIKALLNATEAHLKICNKKIRKLKHENPS